MKPEEITFLIVKSYAIGVVGAVIHFWWLWLGILAFIAIKFHLITKLSIHSLEELFNYLLVKTNPKLNKYQLPEEIVFPKGFVWALETVFKFGEYGSIEFQEGENIGKQIFKYFTEAKGNFVRVKDISRGLNTSGSDIRARIKILNNRLGEVKGIEKGFVKIKPSGRGSYRLYISPLLNNPKD